ncbi:MAG TPA: formylglycine-generating enzyme family protein, partial [Acidimicrobiia bacterium]|nr:formylglycine-generating enzyme family protein [Acidimicrobiia bacterium]
MSERRAEPPTGAPRAGMVWVPGGEFLMGSDDFYPEERPVRREHVHGFWIDAHPVTVTDFDRFVRATGRVTLAERAPSALDYPDADPALLVPGSLVFTPPERPVPLDDFRRWWSWVPGASWRAPEGPGSDTDGREDHPVTHVGFDDALAYLSWAGKALPTEAEWEFAARGGLDGATYPWGDEPTPDGPPRANTWQGEFPWQNTLDDGYARTSPVGAFPPNGYGLFDVVGNVWEWTADPYTEPDDTPAAPTAPCCAAATTAAQFTRHVIKGGSHLCAPSYCLRYRPAARQGEPVDSTTSHLGFRG